MHAAFRQKVMIAGGGTGGHVFPALAVANELRRRRPHDEILFVGVGSSLEKRVILSAGFPLHTIPASGFKGVGLKAKARSLWLLGRSTLACQRLLQKFNPNVVFGVGGYVSAPTVFAAALSRRPTVVFEANVEPGLANRALAPLVTRAAVTYDATLRFFGTKAVRTGSPVREEFFCLPAKKHQPPFTLLIFGGSQGAVALNAAVIEALDILRVFPYPLQFLHQSGERDYETVSTSYLQRGIHAEVFSFIDNMAERFAQADLLICRAGASTVAEIAAAGKAAILVPFPYATDQHQLRNAQALARAGAARLIPQDELTGKRLVAEILDLLEHPEKIQALEEGVRRFAAPDAAARIADLIESVAR